VLERFFDETGGMQLVIHSPFGSRLNRAWGLALRKRFCRKFNFELQAAATEDNIVLSLTTAHSFSPKDAWLSVTAQEAAPSDAIVPRRAWQGGRSLAQFPAFVSSLSFNSPARMRASWARSRQCLGSSASRHRINARCVSSSGRQYALKGLRLLRASLGRRSRFDSRYSFRCDTLAIKSIDA
jgi:hypothetical protein